MLYLKIVYSFKKLDEESLRKLYSDFGFRAKKIANIVGLTESAILLLLKKHNIPTNSRNYPEKKIDVEYLGRRKDDKNKLTKDVLQELYSKGLTDKAIGEIFGLTGEGVAYRRKKWGIDTNTPSVKRARLNRERGLMDVVDLSKEELRNELRAYRGIKGVARKYSSTFSFVKSLVYKHGLNRDEVLANRYRFSPVQQKLIIAGLLGDGGVYDGGIRGFYYKEGHSVSQLEYLKWKMKLFGDLVLEDIYFDTRKSQLDTVTEVASFRTKKCIEMAYYRDLFYDESGKKPRKIIPETVLSSIDAFVFSVWYFDDGGISDNKLPYVCSSAPMDQVIRASEHLNESFDVDSYVEERSDVSLIFMKNKEMVFHLTKNYVLPCFYYKIPIDYRFQIPKLETDVSSLPDKIKSYEPKKWRELTPQQQRVWVENVAKYYSFKGFPYFKIRSRSETSAIFDKLRDIDIVESVRTTGLFRKVPVLGSDLASSYFPHMWSAEIRGKRSVYNNYKDSKRFKKVIENVFRYRPVLTDASIRSELRHGATVQNFKPIIAKTLYDMYCPEGGTVFDYSAGYGGRMIGAAVSARVSTYIGTDPCQQTFFGLRKLSRRLKSFFPDKKFKIHHECSEDFEWYDQIGPVDLCFSSPPYFDTERYSKEDTQSYMRYPDCDLWLESFLGRVISNCEKILRPGGVFMMNIADTGRYELQKPAFEKMSRLFKFERCFFIQMPGYFRDDHYEPIFVFKKEQPVGGRSYDFVMNVLQLQPPIEDRVIRRKRNTSHRVFSDDDKIRAIDFLKKINSEGQSISRNSVKKLSYKKFPFSVSSVEKAFGSWNKFIRECGLEPQYEVHSPRKHTLDYLEICKRSGSILSFYGYEKETGNPSTRLKRLFNAGRPFNHLRNELKEVALCPDQWDNFLKKMK